MAKHARSIGRIAGTREELIFAWRRSGFIVGEHSQKLMPDSDYAEWEDAMDEYFFLKEEGFDPFYVFTYLSGSEYENYKSLVNRLEDIIIALGFSYTIKKRFSDSAGYFRHALVGRSIRSLRTIREMYKSRYDDDCLAIARSVYESYLRLVLLRRQPSSSARFEAMLAHEAGLFPNKLKKNGEPDYSKCVNPETGEEFEITISNREILKISEFPLESKIYYDLYPLLSGHVHPEPIQDILKSIYHDQTDQRSEGDSVRSIVLILSICILFLLEVARSNYLSKRTIRDVLYVCSSVYRDLQKFLLSPTLLDKGAIPMSVYALMGVSIEAELNDSKSV
jgi:hypothetical protein